MDRELDSYPKVVGSSLRSGRNCRWGEWMYSTLSPPSIPWLRCPWARHQTPNCSPGTAAKIAVHCCGVYVHGVCVCVHCCVCALGWVKCRAQILSMGHHTWPHVTSLKKKNSLYGSRLSIFLLLPKIIRILSKDHVPWRHFVNFLP